MRPRPLRLLAVYGTRPEAIKMAPVIAALRRRPSDFEVTVGASGQHRELAEQAEDALELTPDVDLALMKRDQTLNGVAAAALAAIDGLLAENAPDWLLVQGDTTTAMAAGLAAFHRGVAVGHVEAGLRTGDLAAPFPEEANRRIVDLVASALFAPTDRAAAALRAEGYSADRIHVVGNTGIDALLAVAAGIPAEPLAAEVLVTVHRRESFGAPLRRIFEALRELAGRFPEISWVYPVHPNPRVRETAHELLGGISNLLLEEPLGYRQLVRHLLRCRLVLTDSGGLQEEAPTLGKPVLVLRERTERPEAVEAGVTMVVGTETQCIVDAACELLSSSAAYAARARRVDLYGDGNAGERIAAILAGDPWSPFVPTNGGTADSR